MAQFARPTNDENIASSFITNSTGSPDFYTSIDEVMPDDNTSFLSSSQNHGENSIFGLTSVTAPSVNTGHILRARCFGTGGAFNFYLKQGGVTIYERLNEDFSDGQWRTIDMVLSEVEAANITNYSNLTFEFNVPTQGNRGEVLYITQAELETPDSSGGLVKLIKVGNDWKNIDNIQVATGGSWKNYISLQIETQNNWKNT